MLRKRPNFAVVQTRGAIHKAEYVARYLRQKQDLERQEVVNKKKEEEEAKKKTMAGG